MSKKAYKYRHVKGSNEHPSERVTNEVHSEIITLYDTDELKLEKVAVIHNPHHFGGKVSGVRDTYPYPESDCPCNGGRPPVRVWNGKEIWGIPFDDWARNPEVPILYLDP